MMKAALLVGFTLVLLGVKTGFAQTNITNDYIILSKGSVTDETPYITSLDIANWDVYRLQNKRVQLSFDNGFTIELKSAAELVASGYHLDISSYLIEKPQGYVSPLLKLLPGNIIGMEIQSTPQAKYH